MKEAGTLYNILLPSLLASMALSATIRPCQSQEPDTLPHRLAPVKVTVTRDAPRSLLDLPFAITAAVPDSSRPGLRHIALDELLAFIPGVVVANRSNPTQDPRISVRGFGSRSSFGVRGIRVLRDGIPLTLPDGQTPVDYLDLESVGRIEVIRGSASAFYGNASGGILDVRSIDPSVRPLRIQARGWAGSSGMARLVGSASGTKDAFRYQANASHGTTDGYRDHSRQEVTSGFGRIMARLGGTEISLHATGFDMPLAENPGALTAAEAAANPQKADPNFVRRRARKEVRQGQLGLVASRARNGREIMASLHTGGRSLDNPLTFAIIDVERTTYGGNARATLPVRFGKAATRWSIGIDLQEQDDDRLNFENCNDTIPLTIPTSRCPNPGSERGALRLDQRELISSVGAFLIGEVSFAERYRLLLGGRADEVKFKVEDRLVVPGSNADDSGERRLSAVSPVAGVVAQLGTNTALYANVSSAFETPTATELANQPDGTAGINQDLKPQYVTSYELGVKGLVLASRLRYDIAAFRADVRDELIPFEVLDGSGRRYFRNAGRTRRWGAEAGLTVGFGALEAGATYTYSDFQFDEYTVDGIDYGGNRLPGIPSQQFQVYTTWRRGRWFTTMEGLTSGSVAADDANSARIPGYEVVNLRAGGDAGWRRSSIAPVFGINNLFDRRYTPSVSVNAFGGRFYETAPGRVIFGGLRVAVGERESR